MFFLGFGGFWGSPLEACFSIKTENKKNGFWKCPHSRTEWPFSKKTPMKHVVSIIKTHSKFRIEGFVFLMILRFFRGPFGRFFDENRKRNKCNVEYGFQRKKQKQMC